jgi:predicted DNA-binding transcriptional regulator AlpA
MVTATSVAALTLKQRGDNIKRRVDRALETFPLLPDEALIEIRAVSALLGRSRASIWRDVAAGRLAAPIKIGGSTRWPVGGVRAAMVGASHE